MNILIIFGLFLKVALASHDAHESAKPPTLNKLCSWNVLTWSDPVFYGDTWEKCRYDLGRNYIPENNIPWSFAVQKNGRVFVGVKRDRSGVYSTLNYFNISDIVDGKCPPLKSYPTFEENDLKLSKSEQIINVDRFEIDICRKDPKLWIVDLGALDKNGVPLEISEPVLKIFRLNDDTLLRSRPIPTEMYGKYQLGLTSVVVNVNPHNCDDSHAYIIDTYNAAIIVYSWKKDKFWRFKSPLFYADAKYSRFVINTLNGNRVSYSRNNHIYSGTCDLHNQQLIFHSVASLDEFAISFSVLHNESLAKCSPDNLGILYLGSKNDLGQTGSHAINRVTQSVWGIQEQNYAITCWNRDKPLTPNAVRIVTANRSQLPYLVDITRTNGNIYVLTNNYRGIVNDGFDPSVANFGIYYINETLALRAFPECATFRIPHYHPKYSCVANEHQSFYPPEYSYDALNYHNPYSFPETFSTRSKRGVDDSESITAS